MGHPVGMLNSPVEYLDSLVVVSLGRVQHGVGVDLGAGRPRVGLALVRELLGLLAVEEEAFGFSLNQEFGSKLFMCIGYENLSPTRVVNMLDSSQFF